MGRACGRVRDRAPFGARRGLRAATGGRGGGGGGWGGGCRPAYNVQLGTDTGSGMIVGVSVSNRGSDQGEAAAMEQQVVQRTGRHPGAYLIDGGFVSLQDIVALEQQGVAVYAPLPPVKSPRARPEPTTPR